MKKRIISIILVLTLIFSLSINTSASNDLSGLKICVDAGHGGWDSGAQGNLGLFNGSADVYEKDFTLTFALELANELENRGATVYMTRDDDTYVSINGRWQGATAQNVDAFISYHFDWTGAPAGLYSLYGDTRPQDYSFSQQIHNSILATTSVSNRGVKDDTHSFIGSLGVLRYGGDYPRTLIEVNNMDYSDMQGYELLTEAVDYARGVCNGLQLYFN